MKFRENPSRVTYSMDESCDSDELIEALADNVVVDPENVHSVSVADISNVATANCEIEVTFNNLVGQTCAVDSILEKMNMRDWRVFCDRVLVKMIEISGQDPDAYDWPNPRPEVTKVPENDNTDIIASVRVKWELDKKTWHAAKAYVENKDQYLIDEEEGEETCYKCDAQIKYRTKKGMNVVTCPECGALNPLCSECTRPERGQNACGRCKIYTWCMSINKHMAEWR